MVKFVNLAMMHGKREFWEKQVVVMICAIQRFSELRTSREKWSLKMIADGRGNSVCRGSKFFHLEMQMGGYVDELFYCSKMRFALTIFLNQRFSDLKLFLKFIKMFYTNCFAF